MQENSKIFLEILDQKQLEIFELLEFTKEKFYLAGGTALALQIGHRKSIDFDFFANEKFDAEILRAEIEGVFKNYKLTFVQVSPSTINMLVDEVKMSFFYYPYKPVNELIELDKIKMVGLMDIACMKCSAVTGRSVQKDYIDLFFLLKRFSLKEILDFCELKLPSLNKNVILKSLVYFEEVKPEGVIFLQGYEVSFDEVKKFLIAQVKIFSMV